MLTNHSKVPWNLIFWTTHFMSLFGFILSLFLMSPRVEGFSFERLHSTVSLVEFITVFLSFAIFRSFLNRFVDWSNITFNEVVKVIVFTIVGGLIMQLILHYLLYGVVIKFFPDQTVPYTFFVGPYLKLMDSVLTSFSWVFAFFAVKMMINYKVFKLEAIALADKVKQEEMTSISNRIDFSFMSDSIELTKRLVFTDVDRARKTLTQLSDVLRYNLTQSNFKFVTIQEELVMVKDYLNLVEGYYDTHLALSQKISSKFLNVLITPMKFQNIIKEMVSTHTTSVSIGIEVMEGNKYKAEVKIINNKVEDTNIHQELNALFSKDEHMQFTVIGNEFRISFNLFSDNKHNSNYHE